MTFSKMPDIKYALQNDEVVLKISYRTDANDPLMIGTISAKNGKLTDALLDEVIRETKDFHQNYAFSITKKDNALIVKGVELNIYDKPNRNLSQTEYTVFQIAQSAARKMQRKASTTAFQIQSKKADGESKTLSPELRMTNDHTGGSMIEVSIPTRKLDYDRQKNMDDFTFGQGDDDELLKHSVPVLESLQKLVIPKIKRETGFANKISMENIFDSVRLRIHASDDELRKIYKQLTTELEKMQENGFSTSHADQLKKKPATPPNTTLSNEQKTDIAAKLMEILPSNGAAAHRKKIFDAITEIVETPQKPIPPRP